MKSTMHQCTFQVPDFDGFSAEGVAAFSGGKVMREQEFCKAEWIDQAKVEAALG